MARMAAAEKKVDKAFAEIVSLIFHILSEETTPEATLTAPVGAAQTKRASPEKKPTAYSELRPATKALIEILHHKPGAYGINRSNWTQESLAEAFEKLYGQMPSKSTVSRLLKQAGLSWKKSRKVLTSPDPNYREKVELLLRTLQSLKADEDLFFIDELGPLQIRRYGGRCYIPKGEAPSHPQNQRAKGSITIYGALSAITNQVTWFYGDTKDSAGMIDLVEILYNQFHCKSKIYLTWDAASWHGSNELVEWADELNAWNGAKGSGPRIEFIPLPASAQFLDVIEAVFSAMKRAVIHNSDYQSQEEMKTAISMHFKHNPKRAGKRIWEIDFFKDHNHIRSGNYREW
jgi:DDE superfamily endonuclease/winged helix-turn-helix protein